MSRVHPAQIAEKEGSSIYCPVCRRTIHAENLEEVQTGLHVGYVFVHDSIPHDEQDLAALRYRIQ